MKRFEAFEICNANGTPVQGQHPKVYVSTHTITRVVKAPHDNVTYLDLGASGIYVKGNYEQIAASLNEQQGQVSWSSPLKE